MSASVSVALPPSLRRRGEIVGAWCGLLCFPIVFNVGGCAEVLPTGPPGVILPMVLGSALAGIVGCVFGQGRSDEEAGSAPRVGVRGGLVAALVGGAVTVFAATLHAAGLGHAPEGGNWQTIFALVLPRWRPLQVLILALLGIPPAIFFGMAGAFLTAMLRLPTVSGADEAKTAPRSAASSALFTAILILSLIGYLSPFALPLIPKPKPIVVVPLIPPVIEPPPAPPPPPKWAYRKPGGLNTAEAQNLDVSEQRSLGEIVPDLPVALAPDGRTFACCVRRDNRVNIEVRDLETLDTLGRCTTAAEPVSFAWSPDSRRLLFTTDYRGQHLAVFDHGENRLYPLPQPKNARMPDGLPYWWQPKEVLFLAAAKPASVLDLDTLRVRPVEESAAWKALTKEQQEEVPRNFLIHLSLTPRWRMTWSSYFRDYDVPPKTAIFPAREILHFALIHPAKSYVRIFPGISANTGDSFLAAEDGSKMVRIRNGQAEVFYFGLRLPPILSFRVKMPGAQESSLADALTKKTLCGVVCAPLINPLNGKTVGPDRERVKALARIAQWNGADAEAWIEEEYLPVQPGDVLADLHTWEERSPKGAGEAGRGEWWTVIEAPAAPSALPLRKDVLALDPRLNITVASTRGADRIQAVEVARPRRPPAAATPPLPPSPPPPPTAPTDSAETQRLVDFIIAHHAKSSRGDVNGLVADYAERVDHFNHGIVDREFIRKDEAEYHAPGVRVSETVRTQPVIERLGGNLFVATYTMVFERRRPDGRWTKGVAEVALQIALAPDGPKITRQRSEIRERQQGP